MNLLNIENVSVTYPGQTDPALRNVTLEVQRGEVVALVGESGSGKSTLTKAVLQLLPAGTVTDGQISLDGTDILALSQTELRKVRGAEIGVVPQDPGGSLNPVKSIGSQLGEVFLLHQRHDKLTRPQRRRRCIELLEAVGIDRPEQRLKQYPHELSGGLKQRVLIAIAFALRPQLLIADEPTSALDVTVQKRVLDVFDQLRREYGTTVLFVTHDIALAADYADRIAVMSQGNLLEVDTVSSILTTPTYKYTKALISQVSAQHNLGTTGTTSSNSGAAAVEVQGLTKTFGSATTARKAVDDVSFTVAPGTTFALVGESGSGKSTTARLLMRLTDPDAGRILVGGHDVTEFAGAEKRELWKTLQLVCQNPDSAMNPRQTIEEIITEPLLHFGLANRAGASPQVAELLEQVRLPAELARARPGHLSGGQRQRVAIARALASGARTLVLDEAISALDVLTQATILELLEKLQQTRGLTYVFISHDLHIVERIADQVAVMSGGKLVEIGPTEQIFHAPQHDYTRQLLAARPGEILLASCAG